MSGRLNESIVKDAALEWFGELGNVVGHGAAFAGLRRAKPYFAPGEDARRALTPAITQQEREKRVAIRALCPAIPSHTFAILRGTLLCGEIIVRKLEQAARRDQQ